MNNAVFAKAMENVTKHGDIKLVTTNKRRNHLVSEPNYHTTKYFSKHLMAIEMKRTKVKMNKPVYLGMSILDISTTRWCWKMDRQDDKRSLPIAKNKKVIGIFKDELGRKIIKEFVALRAKNVHT